ncbi:MAG: hypothetical protein M3143_08615 [Actinomycetota bacterium]|nr:hypothetical protein [Actinomycetota bacterium]
MHLRAAGPAVHAFLKARTQVGGGASAPPGSAAQRGTGNLLAADLPDADRLRTTIIDWWPAVEGPHHHRRH